MANHRPRATEKIEANSLEGGPSRELRFDVPNEESRSASAPEGSDPEPDGQPCLFARSSGRYLACDSWPPGATQHSAVNAPVQHRTVHAGSETGGGSEWLRREGRRLDAREQLRIAHEMFTVMGTDAFAERARRDLLATGHRARKRIDETRADFTPQEARSPASPATASPIPGSVLGSSSVPALSNGIFARCSPNSVSALASSFG